MTEVGKEYSVQGRIHQAEQDWIMLPWSEVNWDNPFPIFTFIFGIFAAATALHFLQQWWYRFRIRQKEQTETTRLCREKGLDTRQTASLAEALLSSPLEFPGLALNSRFYFDRFLAKPIARKATNEFSELLREALFGSFSAMIIHRSPLFPDTRTIRKGESIRVHFPSHPGHLQGMVVANDEDGLSLIFPHEKDRLYDFKKGERVEGTFEEASRLMGFSTTVSSVKPGAVTVCLLAHTDEIGELQHRESLSAKFEQDITFHFLPTGTPLKIPAPETKGILCDMTLGGCTIETKRDEQYQCGCRIAFHLRIPGRRAFRLIAEVFGVEASAKDRIRLQVRFHHVDDAVRHDLAMALYDLHPRARRGNRTE